MQHLIVVRPFGSWGIGDVIEDQESIVTVLESEHAEHVVRIQPPEEN